MARFATRAQWHYNGDWRCRVCSVLYRVSRSFSRLADRIDDPRRHLA